MRPAPSSESGFTLAELIVASTIVVLVMGAVYASFGTSLLLWRRGEADFAMYQEARTALALLERELQNVVPGAAPLFEGEDDELTFFAVAPPLDVSEGPGARVLRIRYRVRPNPSGPGRILTRDEANLDSEIVIDADPAGGIDVRNIETGRDRRFDLAAGVHRFDVQYHYLRARGEAATALGVNPLEPEVADEHVAGRPLPRAVEVTLVMIDPGTATGETTFQALVPIRGNRLTEAVVEAYSGRPPRPDRSQNDPLRGMYAID